MLTFDHPQMFPWLAVGAIPLLLHLLSKRPLKRLDLPTVRFLQRAADRGARPRRWRDIALLALRTCAMFAAALAFAKPTWNAALPKTPESRSAVALILDLSASMGYGRGGVTTLARAKAQALRTLDTLGPSARANLILCASRSRGVFNELSADRAALISAVRAAQPMDESADANQAITLASDHLAASSAGDKRLYVFSDFQRTNWSRAEFSSLPPGTRLLFVNADSGERPNVGIKTLRLSPSTARVGETADVICEVFNSSSITRSVDVRFELSQHATTVQPISIPAFSTAQAVLRFTPSGPGFTECAVSLAPDDLPADDQRQLAIEARSMPNVALLTHEDLNSRATGSFYLLRALRPNPSSSTAFRVTIATSADRAALPLQKVVFISGSPALSNDDYAKLAGFVEDGGALLWMLSGPTIVKAVGQFAAHLPRTNPAPFLVEHVTDVTAQGRGYLQLSDARLESPLFKLFRDPSTGDLRHARFYRICGISRLQASAEALLRFDDGSPAAALSSVGRGSVLFLNFSPAPAWSDLARRQLFLPLVHELVKGVVSQDERTVEHLVGSVPIVPIRTASGPVRCIGPDDNPVAVEVDRIRQAVTIVRANRPGFYRVESQGKALAVVPVNVSADETDLRAIDPRPLASPSAKGRAYLTGGSGRDPDVLALHYGLALWQYLLAFALLALLAEQVLGAYRPHRG